MTDKLREIALVTPNLQFASNKADEIYKYLARQGSSMSVRGDFVVPVSIRNEIEEILSQPASGNFVKVTMVQMEHERAVYCARWGSRGWNRKHPTKWFRLIDCSTGHLKAILRTQSQISTDTREIIQSILDSRSEYRAKTKDGPKFGVLAFDDSDNIASAQKILKAFSDVGLISPGNNDLAMSLLVTKLREDSSTARPPARILLSLEEAIERGVAASPSDSGYSAPYTRFLDMSTEHLLEFAKNADVNNVTNKILILRKHSQD